jgi:hypothetical protein
MLTTPDAVQATLENFTGIPNRVYLVNANVLAIAQDLSSQAGYRLFGVFKTDAAGAMTQVGATTVVAIAETNAALDATLDANVNDIRVRVTGLAATNINWRGNLDIDHMGV